MSSHPLDVFPALVWTRIFQHAKRPWPSVSPLGGHESCYQPVLAALMRIHPAIHDLVAPVLYRESVVVDLEMFFEGLDGQTRRPEDSDRFWTEACKTYDPKIVPTVPQDSSEGIITTTIKTPSPGSMRRSSKRDLLGHVKVLHLAVPSLKKSPIGYSRFYGLDKVQVFGHLATRRGLDMLQRASDTSTNPLCNLDKITLDLYHEPNIEYVGPSVQSDPVTTKILDYVRDDLFAAFDRSLAVIRPKWVCQHRPPQPSFGASGRNAHFMETRLAMANDPLTIFVCHDPDMTNRWPAGYACRLYMPPPLKEDFDLFAVFSGVLYGDWYHFVGMERMLGNNRWSLWGKLPKVEIILMEQSNPSSQTHEPVLKADEILECIRLGRIDQVRVIDGENEAQSPWGPCGCPAPATTEATRKCTAHA